MNKNKFIISSDEHDLGKNLCKQIKKFSDEAIAKRGNFYVGFSGGSLSNLLCENLPELDTEWPKWKIFMCDERYVPEDSPDSNYGFYKKHLLDKVSLKVGENIFPIDSSLPIEECANAYEQTIRNELKCQTGVPEFDLNLLGIGPDGHTCSLFPNHPQLLETQKLITIIKDSPKPPPQRITMTLPVLNNTKNIIVTTAGDKKAHVLSKIADELNTEIRYPIEMVQPKSGEKLWYVDKVAASTFKHHE